MFWVVLAVHSFASHEGFKQRVPEPEKENGRIGWGGGGGGGAENFITQELRYQELPILTVFLW